MGKIPFGLLGSRENVHAPLCPKEQVGSWAMDLWGINAKGQMGRWLEAYLLFGATGCRQTGSNPDVDLAAPPGRHEQSRLRSIGRVVSRRRR